MVLPVVWALLAGLALALSWVTGVGAFAWVGYLMLAALGLGAAAGRLGARGLRASRWLSADRVSLGGEVEVEVEVENRSRLPALWLYAAETLPAGLSMSGVRGRVGPLGGGGRFGFRYTLQGARRGYYQIGPTVLRTGDLFGLSVKERAEAPAVGLTVFPKIVAIQHARLPSRRSIGDVRARHRVLEDPVQVVGIRPYERSDGMRRVHWRATAHTGRLQSKLYELSSQVATALALNLRRSEYPSHPGEAEEAGELAIVTAASVAHHVLDRRQQASLLAAARDLAATGGDQMVRVGAGRGREQLTRILSALGRVSLGQVAPLAAALDREKEALAWGSLVVVITPSVGAELLRVLLNLRTSGFDVTAILVGRGPALAAGRAGLGAVGIRAMSVRSEADIHGLGL